MAKIDEKFHNLLQHILNEGYRYEDPNRKGVYRRQISDYKIIHDFRDGFPALTTKELYWKGVIGELLWILRGEDNIKYLVDNNINIWNKDAYNYYLKKCKEVYKSDFKPMSFETFIKQIKNGNKGTQNSGYTLGDIGRGYGAQLRNWKGNAVLVKHDWEQYNYIDQFAKLINTLKTNPMATKKTVTFWNPTEKKECALTPCHWSFEVLVEPLSELYRAKQVSLLGYDFKMPISNEEFTKLCDNKWKIPKYQFTLKWHQHSVDTFLGR